MLYIQSFTAFILKSYEHLGLVQHVKAFDEDHALKVALILCIISGDRMLCVFTNVSGHHGGGNTASVQLQNTVRPD